jgi:hypothetical protein
VIAPDKVLHFFAAFVLGLIGPGLAIGASFGKEIWDAVSGGVASAGDLIADGFGIFFASLFSPFF